MEFLLFAGINVCAVLILIFLAMSYKPNPNSCEELEKKNGENNNEVLHES